MAFGGFVDQTGGSLICKGDPALNRITKYIPQLPASDFKGETLYLRFKSGAGYKIFSPFFVPTLDPYDRYECHVGLGYNHIISEFYNIRTDIKIFVPVGTSQVIRDITITNISKQAMELDAIPVVEYSHFDALKQFINADWIPQTMQSQAVAQANGLKVLVQYPFMCRDTKINYFTSNCPMSSFDTDRKIFLGQNEYGTWANPLSLQQSELNNSEALRGDNIAAAMHHLGELKPGESRRLITQLGQAPSLAEAQPAIDKYRQAQAVDEAFVAIKEFWKDYLAKFQIKTPDESMNAMLNVHHPFQCYITKNWSRDLSLYQLGFGGRGIGFRDSSQDVMGVLSHIPTEGQALIRQLLHVQQQNGSAMHQFYASTMVGSMGDSHEVFDGPKYYSDDHLWIILATTAYIKETGDLAFLDEVIPFYEKDNKGQPVESGKVLEHLRRAIEFTRTHVGAHGLPLLGFADWNDTINLRAGAESLLVANLYGKALLELTELARYTGDTASAEKYMAYHQEMAQRVNEHAWDGGWYVSYFEADGTPLGSHTNAHGKIYNYGQSWPIIANFASPDQARAAMDAVYTHLNTTNGIKVSTPGFNAYDPTKGGVTTYPPGAKENSGIFLHTNPWAVVAETMLGRGNRAFEYYNQINPAAKNDSLDEFESEPYVYPQNILGDEHPQFGLGRNSWLSGTASWAYQAATQYIFGLKPTYAGLQIDPCLPDQWDGFTVVREFRQARYQIEVQNPQHVCRGVKAVSVDGTAITGNILPVFKDGQLHQVTVVMG